MTLNAPHPLPALKFFEGGQGDTDDANSSKTLNPAIAVYAQLTGFYTDENGAGFPLSYMDYNWKDTVRLNHFFEDDQNDLLSSRVHSPPANGDNCDAKAASLITTKMDEARALKIIRRFLKVAVVRRRRSHVLALWRLVKKTSSKRGLSERNLMPPTETQSMNRPLAEMENEEESMTSTTCAGKENVPPNAVHVRTKDAESKSSSLPSPCSVSCMNLSQWSKSFFPKRSSLDKASGYSSDFSSNYADIAPNPNHNHVDSLVVNIIRHNEEKVPIPFAEIELPNLDLNAYISTDSTCKNEYVEWRPFDIIEENNRLNQPLRSFPPNKSLR